MAFSTTKLALVSLLASTALASASNHRHHRRHRHLRRDVVWETDVVTDVAVVTQYVTAGAPAPAAPAATSTSVVQAAEVAPSPVAHQEAVNWSMFGHHSSSAAPAAPSAPQTTLATVVSSVPPTSAAPTSAAPTSVAPSSAAAPSASATSSPTTGGKRGVAFNSASLTDLFTTSAFSWAYNWGCDASGSILSSLEYVPMLWGNTATFTSAWDAQVAVALAAGSKHILGFNEPDHTEQANMSPADAVTAWNQYIQPYSSKASLISPAVTNGAAPMGLSWLTSFLDACSGCSIDAVAIHWYDSATNIDYFKQYMTDAHTQTGKPLWITEFGATGSDDEVSSFLSEVLPWLDSQDFVERYSYFMAADGTLLTGNALSTYGKTYVDAA